MYPKFVFLKLHSRMLQGRGGEHVSFAEYSSDRYGTQFLKMSAYNTRSGLSKKKHGKYVKKHMVFNWNT